MPRFSVLTALLCVTFLAVLVSGYITYRQSQFLVKIEARNELLETRQKVYTRAMQLLRSYNTEDLEESELHHQLLWMIHEIPPIPETLSIELPAPWFWGTKTELASIESDSGRLELLVMNYNTHSIPGGVTTVLALFQDGKLIDSKIRDKSTRCEASHEIRIVDVNSDGKLDVLIEIEPGMLQNPVPSVAFEISDTGLKLLTD